MALAEVRSIEVKSDGTRRVLGVLPSGAPFDVVVRNAAALKAALRGLDAMASAPSDIAAGPLELAEPAPPEPPVVDAARDQFFADLRAHQTQEKLAALPQALRDAYKPEYGDF